MPYRYSIPFNGKSHDDLVGQYLTVAEQLNGDAMLVGRPSIQEMLFPKTFDHKNGTPINDTKTFVGKLDGTLTFITLDPNGKVFYDNVDDNSYIAILSEKVSKEYLLHLEEKQISYLFAGADGSDLNKALDTLTKDFGLRTILLEGGGTINGLFLKAGLIDELSLFMYPGIDGLSGIPSIFEYKGEPNEKPASGQALELVSLKQLEDGIAWLYYKFHKI